jgi:hypothetical protein
MPDWMTPEDDVLALHRTTARRREVPLGAMRRVTTAHTRLALHECAPMPAYFTENFGSAACPYYRRGAVANGTCMINAFLQATSPSFRSYNEQLQDTIGVGIRKTLFAAWEAMPEDEREFVRRAATALHPTLQDASPRSFPGKYKQFLDSKEYLGQPELNILYAMYGIKVFLFEIRPVGGRQYEYSITNEKFAYVDAVRTKVPRIALVSVDGNHYESVYAACQAGDVYAFPPKSAQYKEIMAGYKNTVRKVITTGQSPRAAVPGRRARARSRSRSRSRSPAPARSSASGRPRSPAARDPPPPPPPPRGALRRPSPRRPEGVAAADLPPDGWPAAYKYLTNLVKTAAHARGIVFVSVSKPLVMLLAGCKEKDDASIAAHVRRKRKVSTDAFVRYAVEVNRILREDVRAGHMCEVYVRTVEWEEQKKRKGKGKELRRRMNADGSYEMEYVAPMSIEYVDATIAQEGPNFPVALVLALQVVDSAAGKPTTHCVAMVSFKPADDGSATDDNVDGAVCSNRMEFVPHRDVHSPSAAALQAALGAGKVMEITLLCARARAGDDGRASRETQRLLCMYAIAKQLQSVSGGAPRYSMVSMDCASYVEDIGARPSKVVERRVFPAERTAQELGFRQRDVRFPEHPAASKANLKNPAMYRSRNVMFSNTDAGTNKMYILADDARATIADKLTYYLHDHIAGSDMLKKLCPMTPRTGVPACA